MSRTSIAWIPALLWPARAASAVRVKVAAVVVADSADVLAVAAAVVDDVGAVVVADAAARDVVRVAAVVAPVAAIAVRDVNR